MCFNQEVRRFSFDRKSRLTNQHFFLHFLAWMHFGQSHKLDWLDVKEHPKVYMMKTTFHLRLTCPEPWKWITFIFKLLDAVILLWSFSVYALRACLTCLWLWYHVWINDFLWDPCCGALHLRYQILAGGVWIKLLTSSIITQSKHCHYSDTQSVPLTEPHTLYLVLLFIRSLFMWKLFVMKRRRIQFFVFFLSALCIKNKKITSHIFN